MKKINVAVLGCGRIGQMHAKNIDLHEMTNLACVYDINDEFANSVAKELNVPVIALSHLSRAVETRGGSKRPILSDLRESGAIEQDADIVSFIYRPEYYKIDEWDDEERTPSAGQAEFIVAKHRNGGLNNIKLKFISNLGKFENLDNFETPFEYQSKINKDDLKVNPDQAFESGGYREDNDDMPF